MNARTNMVKREPRPRDTTAICNANNFAWFYNARLTGKHRAARLFAWLYHACIEYVARRDSGTYMYVLTTEESVYLRILTSSRISIVEKDHDRLPIRNFRPHHGRSSLQSRESARDVWLMRPWSRGHHFSISQRENLNAPRRANRVGEKGRSCVWSCNLLFVSVVMMRYKKTQGKREKEHACSNGLPLCCALGVSSIAPRPSRKRKRPRRLADTYNPDSLQ